MDGCPLLEDVRAFKARPDRLATQVRPKNDNISDQRSNKSQCIKSDENTSTGVHRGSQLVRRAGCGGPTVDDYKCT